MGSDSIDLDWESIESDPMILHDPLQSAGQILSAVTLPSAETELLAVVELSALMVAPQVEGAPLTQLQFEHPPYWNA